MDPDAIDRVVRKYAAKIGLARGYSAHSMRATFITTALENGAQLEDVQKAAGHRDPSTTKLYDRRSYNPESAASFVRDLLNADADQDLKKLWGLAAGRCSRPDCGTDCVKFFGSDPTVLGEMAHIIARQPTGRRGVPGGGSNAYDNLILLCPTHHTEIDKAPEGTFPIELLHQWKDAHERRVREALAAKSYTTRAELFRDIRFLLIDNHQIWKTYGPASNEEAQRNPISNAAQFWQLRKVSQIVPNNTKYPQLLTAAATY